MDEENKIDVVKLGNGFKDIIMRRRSNRDLVRVRDEKYIWNWFFLCFRWLDNLKWWLGIRIKWGVSREYYCVV